MDYIKLFVVGSSLPVVLPFYISVAGIQQKTYSYETYSIVAPLYFGCMNMLAGYLSKQVGIVKAYLYTTVLSICTVCSIVFVTDTYSFQTPEEWIRYVARISMFHTFTYMVVLRTLSRMH